MAKQNAERGGHDYHPGDLTCDTAFRHDDVPPMSERTIVTSQKPILYDAHERPIYRCAGFLQKPKL